MEKRYSRKREAIYDALCKTTAHPSAEELYNTLHSSFPDISLATVYRNLVAFKRDGLAISVGVVNGYERFDGNTSAHPHFVCTKCHSVIDIDSSGECKTFVDSIAKRHGFIANTLVIEGLCTACAPIQAMLTNKIAQ